MAFDVEGLDWLNVATGAVKKPKITIGSDLLRGATVSSATATIGSTTTVSSYTALATAVSVTSPYFIYTITAAEIVTHGPTIYVYVLVVLSDGRKIPFRFKHPVIF